jgi:predicted transcriptional regulator
VGKFEEKLQLTKVILTSLEKQGLSRTSLLKRVIDACGSPAKFDTIFDWLKDNGYVAKAGEGHRAGYVITWKGRQFLAGLIAKEGPEK